MEKYFQCHHLSIVDSKDQIRGRYVKCNKIIKKGTVIISSQPLGTVPLPQTAHQFCNYCFRKQISPPLQRCSQCKKSYFCDMDCFKNGWLSYHQYVCKGPIIFRDGQDDMDFELLERVCLNIARCSSRLDQPVENHQEESVQVTIEAFYSLMGHTNLQSPHVKKKHQQLAIEALQKSYIRDLGLSLDELVYFLNVFKSNNLKLEDPEMFVAGEGIYPVAALFNHSCRPNAIISFEGVLATIRAIEDIEAGTEICIAYLDPAHARDDRRRYLHDTYFFKCECVRCEPPITKVYLGWIDTLLGQEGTPFKVDPSYMDVKPFILKEVADWDLLKMCQAYDRTQPNPTDPPFSNNPDQPFTLANYTHYFIRFFAPYLITWDKPYLYTPARKDDAIVDFFDDPLPSQAKPYVQPTYDGIIQAAVEKMMSYPSENRKMPYHLATLRHCSQLFDEEIEEGNWCNAVKLGMYLLVQYCLIYPPFHPILASHYLTLAKVSWNSIVQSDLMKDDMRLEKVYERGLRRWIMSSKETIAVAFGKHTKLWRETIELEWVFLREQKLK